MGCFRSINLKNNSNDTSEFFDLIQIIPYFSLFSIIDKKTGQISSAPGEILTGGRLWDLILGLGKLTFNYRRFIFGPRESSVGRHLWLDFLTCGNLIVEFLTSGRALRVIFGPLEVKSTKFWPLEGEFSVCELSFRPLGFKCRCLGVELGTLGVVIGPLGVDFRPLRLNFKTVQADLGLKIVDFGHLWSDVLASGGEIHSYLE